MPRLARWLIKTALLCLAMALALGAVRAGQMSGVLPGSAAPLWLPQLHLLTVGWLTQLIFGVAFWLFPTPDRGLASARLVWVAYGALNTGLLLRLACEPTALPAPLYRWGLVASALLQWTASLLFVLHFWCRVRPK